jgi:3(or 17)beta-hydroxysteroid dehydrogenase
MFSGMLNNINLMTMNNRLQGKVALITGGAQGIGHSIASLFAQHGATVIIVDIIDRQEKNKNSSKNLNQSLQNSTDYLKLDVSLENSWLEIRRHIQRKYKKLNILVNNAGINGLNEIQNPENMSLDTWNYIHSVNLSSVFLGCKYGISLMNSIPEPCSIVNIASRSGLVGVPNLAAYASSKSAIRNYTKSVALYCAEKSYNIRCNTISPAAIDTHMWDHLREDGEKFEAYTTSLPLKRMGSIEEVAYAALYLASDESSYTTGSEIIVDGGILSTCGGLPK